MANGTGNVVAEVFGSLVDGIGKVLFGLFALAIVLGAAALVFFVLWMTS